MWIPGPALEILISSSGRTQESHLPLPAPRWF